MSITLYPCKLLTGEIEARVPGEPALLPGQILRLEGEAPVYGQVLGVRAVRKTQKKTTDGTPKSRVVGCIVRLKLLYGQPDFSPQTATVLNLQEIAPEIQRVQPAMRQPATLAPNLTLDIAKLGPLTCIDGDDPIAKADATMALFSAVRPYRKVVVVDPLGLFDNSASLHHLRAGQDCRLSLQSVGHQRFLDALATRFPEGLRNWALQAVAASWPVTEDFISFERLLDWRSVSESPLKTLIMQNHQAIIQAGVFADRPNQVLQWASLAWPPGSILDLSGLSEPWKALFYEEAVRLILAEANEEILPVLVYPEHYLPAWTDYLQRAAELGLNLVILTSLQLQERQEAISTRLIAAASGQVSLTGQITSGLPVVFTLSGALATPSPQTVPPKPPIEAIAPPPPAPPSAPPTLPEVQSPEPTVPEHHKILDQLFANQVSIEQSVLGKASTPKLEPAPQWESAQSHPSPVQDIPSIHEDDWKEVSTAYPESPPTPAPPQEIQEITFPAEESSLLDEFDFDLNLDQKPLETIQEADETFPSQVGTLAGRFSQESEFDNLSLPPSLLELPPSTETDVPGWEEPSWQAAEEAIQTEHPMPGATLEETVPVYTRESTREAAPFQAGDRVIHEKYGEGTVTKVVPMDNGVVLNITFDSVGKRLLDPRLTPLTRKTD